MLDSSWRPLVELKQQVRAMIRELFPRARVFELAIIAVLAGVGEELLFRGVLQTLVGRWTTPVVGLVVASLDLRRHCTRYRDCTLFWRR